MDINTKSWHYRMVEAVWEDFLNKDISTTLCGYFWQVVFAPIICIVLFSAVLAVIAILGAGAFYIIGGIVGDLLANFGILPPEFALEKGVFKWEHVYASIVCDIIIGALWYGRYKHYKYKQEKAYEKNEPKEVNLFVEFIKAKKRKICPILNFVDKDKK